MNSSTDIQLEDQESASILLNTSGTYTDRNIIFNVYNISNGADTSDATATSYDIEKGKTAYINGEKVTGEVRAFNTIYSDAHTKTYSVVGKNSNYLSITSNVDLGDEVIDTSKKVIFPTTGQIVIHSPLDTFGDASPEDVLAGKKFTSSSGFQIAGTASSLDNNEYTFCDYIQSSGSQWIDTGWIHKANSTIVLDVNLIDSSRDSYIAVFGSMNSTYNNNAWTFFSRFGGTSKPALARTGNEGQGSGLIYGSRITIIANGTKAAWTGNNTTTSVTSTGTANDGVITMTLFTNHEGTRFNRHCVMKLYSAKFYTGDILERDFCPAKRNSDNKYGLYDKVNDVFYPSNGTSDFTGA